MVREQDFKRGRDALPAPAQHVRHKVDGAETGLHERDGRVYKEGRIWMDWGARDRCRRSTSRVSCRRTSFVYSTARKWAQHTRSHIPGLTSKIPIIADEINNAHNLHRGLHEQGSVADVAQQAENGRVGNE